MEPGFSNVALTDNSNLDRKRTTSMSSLASDISFLPRYESNFNAYHLQVSAFEKACKDIKSITKELF